MVKINGMVERSVVPVQVKTFSGDHVYMVASIRKENDAADTRSLARSIYMQIAKTINKSGLAIFHERIFGSLPDCKEAISVRNSVFRETNTPHDNPVTCLEGRPAWGSGLAGVIVHAVSLKDDKSKVQTISDDSKPCGREWTKDGIKFLLLQNMQGSKSIDSPADIQAGQAIEEAGRILDSRSSSYTDVVRTWFYLENILDWYDDFNIARNIQYEKLDIMPGSRKQHILLPSSTGISGKNLQGAACCMNLLAISGPKGKRPQVVQLSNAGQADAFSYGSAFSRGAHIKLQDLSLLQISGTAAINEQGESLFPGDIRAQIHCTLDKIKSLMKQVGADLPDISAAVAFIKHPEYSDVFWEILSERSLEDLPIVCVVADVCREELLFEIDAEAIFPNKF